MFCKYCGKEIPEGVNLCPYCHRPIEQFYKQRTRTLERGNQTRYMIFTLGAILLLIGFFAVTYSVEVTRYRSYYGIPIPYQATEYPAQNLGIILIILGIAAIAAGFFYGSKEQFGSG